jgi:hypothetical protein
MLSQATFQDMLAQHSGRIFVECLTLSIEGDEPIHVVNDTVDLVRTVDGEAVTFRGFPVSVVLHNDEDDQLPEASLIIDAVDQTIIRALRAVSGSIPEVRIEAVARDTPDVIDVGPLTLTMLTAETDGVSEVRIKLGYGAIYLTAAFPAITFSRGNAEA